MKRFVCRMCGCNKCTEIYDDMMCDGCSVIFRNTDKFTLPEVKFIKLNDNAVMPVRACDGDVGYDAVSIDHVTLNPFKVEMVCTGIAVQLPKHTEMQVRTRSGMAKRYGIMVVNSPGTIDSGYRGPCNVLLINTGDKPYIIEPGDKIAQFLITTKLPYTFKEVDALDVTERGVGGFGHTGK